MDNDKVSFAVFEGTCARFERTIKRLWILLLITLFLLVGSNVAWLVYESQFEYFETEITQNNETGHNNYIGNDGDIVNGKADNSN